ncbi:MAG: type I-G CRISPR-associated helicase/endonuclease Cas3g [Methylobacter sp.]
MNESLNITNSFENWFSLIFGFRRLEWQQRLFDQFLKNEIPNSLDLPTGLGKTSVMAIWLLARAFNPSLPKRLIYVVDRRVVVDQATEIAESLRYKLQQLPDLHVLLQLGNEPLAVSTLRGQFVDNRQWLADPTKTAIIIGTIDMIGSRLLFEGYGVSRNMRRYHAGFLGADSLCVLDEAHLCLPFEAMLQIVADYPALHPVEAKKLLMPSFKCLSLSATGKQSDKQAFGLEDRDLQDEVVFKRLNAEKLLTLEVRKEGDSISELLSERAWQLKDSGQRILIFCTKREDVKKIKNDLDKRIKQEKANYPVNLLTGGRRVQERQKLVDWLKANGFLAGSSTILETPVFLIATSAGEVGIDLDADHMVCDLVAYERMVQRFGRVNRLGNKQAQIMVIAIPPKPPTLKHPTTPDLAEPQPPTVPAENADKAVLKQYKQDQSAFDKELKSYQKTQEEHAQAVASYQHSAKAFLSYQAQLEIVTQLQGDASPGAILALKQNVSGQLLASAISEEPLRPALTRALVDAWSMTSLEQHSARPDVEPWLRGWLPNKEPETTLAWREYLPWRDGEAAPNATEVEAFFDHAPIHLSETLDVPVYQAVDKLAKRVQSVLKEHDYSTRPALLVLDHSGKLVKNGVLTAHALAEKEPKNLKELLANRQVIVARWLGGLNQEGLLDEKSGDAQLVTLDHRWDAEYLQKVVGYRIIQVRTGITTDEIQVDTETTPDETGWHTVHRFNATLNEQEESTKIWLIQVYRGEKSPQQGDPAITLFNQSLRSHLHWAGEEMAKIAAQLALPAEYAHMLVVAIKAHDLGKDRDRWQNAMKAPPTGRPYAKTKGGGNLKLLAGYRHEFGSLADVANDADINQLPAELQDLALHLIASHHGYACPVIAPIDPDAPPSILGERAQQAALRFARLQRQWGPWGLAWWEAVFRAADHRASKNSKELTEKEGKA